MKVDGKIKRINGLVNDLEKQVNKICTGPNCKSVKAVKKSKVKNSKVEVEQQVK
jgi:hypothetical protein